MAKMSQTRLYFEASRTIAEAASAALEARFGERGFVVASVAADSDDNRWTVSLYVPSPAAETVRGELSDCLSEVDIIADLAAEELPETGWVEKTLAELAPVRAGRFVVHGSHDDGCAAPQEIAIRIEAGLAFGTGHHGTTAGCLAMITRQLRRRRYQRALDLGCGSGVLSIAIAKAAAIQVIASDIDPVATRLTGDNARKNQVAARITTITADGLADSRFRAFGPFDLVVANILAGPLKKMARDLARQLTPGATLILSGLLPHQKPAILSAYRGQGLVFEWAHYRDGWMTLVLNRPQKRRDNPALF